MQSSGVVRAHARGRRFHGRRQHVVLAPMRRRRTPPRNARHGYTETLAPAQTARHVARRVAARAPSSVRARAAFHPARTSAPSRVFSEFHVTNPGNRSVYRVAIRGAGLGDNYCSCPDFATNSLGTCKHVEFVLRKLQARPRTRAVLQRGFRPSYSEIVLQYGAKREVRFRPGTAWPETSAALATKYFDAQRILRANAYAKLRVVSLRGRAPRPRCPVRRRCPGVRGGGARPIAPRARAIADAFPRGVHDSGLRKLLKARALRRTSARAPSSRRGRSLPHRRRHGAWQDDPGDRRRRDHGSQSRRRARADRLPDLAEAPVGTRDRPLQRPAGDGGRGATCSARAAVRGGATVSSRSRTTTPFTPIST